MPENTERTPEEHLLERCLRDAERMKEHRGKRAESGAILAAALFNFRVRYGAGGKSYLDSAREELIKGFGLT